MYDGKVYRIAICGCGVHVERFAKLVNSYEESEMAAAWDPDMEKAQEAADAIGGGCRATTDYDALVASEDIDGVMITASNIYHTDLILKAVKANKSVLVEKPLCLDVEDAHAIRDAVNSSSVKFFMSDPFVENTTIYMKQFIESGKLGKILSARVRFCDNHDVIEEKPPEKLKSMSREMGGGMMSDTGGHPLHVMNYLLGKPEKILAQFSYDSEVARNCGYEQNITMQMTYPDDVFAVVEASLISPEYINEIEVCGTRGVIIDRTAHGDPTPGISYKICTATAEDLKKYPFPEISKRDEWVHVPKEELPPRPDDHIRYWIKMQAYDIPNDRVGVDPASTHGVGINQAVELVEMREAIYSSAKTGALTAVRG